MIAIHTTSIAQLEAELDNKCRELEDVQESNMRLAGQKEQLDEQMTRMQARSLELEKERRQLELQLNTFNEQNNQGDTSAIFQSLYRDVKNILETSI